MTNEKTTNGLNDRPLNTSIGQTAGGFHEDSSGSVEVDEKTIEATREKLSEDPRKKLLKEVKQQEGASRLGSE
jgi:hypothetical protein